MHIVKVFLLLLISSLAHSAYAVKPLSAETLMRYCESYNPAVESVFNIKCSAYIGGFLDGAVATDARVAENVLDEIDREESISERAIRTRVHGRLRSQGSSYYAEFCIGDPVPIVSVIGHVIEELKSRASLADITARSIVYASVREYYPCEK